MVPVNQPAKTICLLLYYRAILHTTNVMFDFTHVCDKVTIKEKVYEIYETNKKLEGLFACLCVSVFLFLVFSTDSI